MTEQDKNADPAKSGSDSEVAGAEGGEDANGPGNILGGVQPSTKNDGKTERRHD